jgi:hypothetical protein
VRSKFLPQLEGIGTNGDAFNPLSRDPARSRRHRVSIVADASTSLAPGSAQAARLDRPNASLGPVARPMVTAGIGLASYECDARFGTVFSPLHFAKSRRVRDGRSPSISS